MPKHKRLLGGRSPPDFAANRRVVATARDPEHVSNVVENDSEGEGSELGTLLLPSIQNRNSRSYPLSNYQALGRKDKATRTLNMVAFVAACILMTWVGFEAFASGSGAITGSALYYMHRDYYDIHSAPAKVTRWVGSRLLTGAECIRRNDTLVARCCAGSCGGFGDRARGLTTLLVVSDSVGRKLCIAPEYFVSGPQPKCTDGTFVNLQGKKTVLFNPTKGPSSKPTSQILGDRHTPLVLKALREAKYLTTAEPTTLPELGSAGEDARQLGMLIVAMSRSINKEMIVSRTAVQSVVGLYDTSSTPHYIGWHVRVGGSSFTIHPGRETHSDSKGYHVRRHTTGTDKEFQFQYVNDLLDIARKLPRSLACKKAIYLASDSSAFLSEMAMALPDGVVLLSCCSAPVHVDRRDRHRNNLQHLVDLQAFAGSQHIFATNGQFAMMGARTNSWRTVPLRQLQGSAGTNETKEYLSELVSRMECTER